MKTFLGFASVAAVVAAALLLHGAGHASSPFAVALANAAVKCPNITDATAHGLPAGSAPTATLSDRCVLDFGIPAGATGATGAMGAPGAAGAPGTNGVSGYSLRSAKIEIDPKGGPAVATAMCAPGKKAIGGGAEYSDGGKSFPSAAITASKPTPNGQGWTATARVTVRHKPYQIASLKVTAVCAVVS